MLMGAAMGFRFLCMPAGPSRLARFAWLWYIVLYPLLGVPPSVFCTLLLGVVSLDVMVCAGCPLGGGCVHCAVLLHSSHVARFGATCVFLEPQGDIRVPLWCGRVCGRGGGVSAIISLRWVPLIGPSGRDILVCVCVCGWWGSCVVLMVIATVVRASVSNKN